MSSKEILFALSFLAAWLVLNRWVLPWFGVPTCMSGCCAAGTCPSGDGKERAMRGETPGTVDELLGAGIQEDEITQGERR